MKHRRAYWLLMLHTRTAGEIEQALLSLPGNISSVLQHHYLIKYSFKEIARKMDLSLGTIRNHHNRGIFLLAKYFGDYDIINHL